MKSPSASRSNLWSISTALVLGAALLVLAPGKLHATSVTYDLTLTDPTNSTYSGTGVVTLSVVPSQVSVDYSADVTALSFTVDGQTFNKTDAGAHLTAFELQTLGPPPTIRDITFADTVGTGLSALTLDSSGGYTFYIWINGVNTPEYGTFGAVTVADTAATPEPSSLMLLGTGLLGLCLLVRRQLTA